MLDFLWLRELLAVVTTVLGGALPSAPVVPATPVVAPVAQAPQGEVFFDDFAPTETGAPAEHWEHLASSTPERTPLTVEDGRTVVRVRPEGNLISREPVPLTVGTTYRVTAAVKMPRRTGTHPAFWLRGLHADRVGEIDVVESWGGEGRCRVQVAFYWRYFPRTGPMECVGDRYPADMSGWHEYAAEFTYAGPGLDPATAAATPTRLFVDGRETWSAPHSPVAPEHLRLQHKRNCDDALQPSCGVPEGDLSGSSMYVDWVRVEVVGRGQAAFQPSGVHAVRPGATGAMELHALDAEQGFGGFAAQTAIPLFVRDWRLTRGDHDGDRVEDLYAVDPSGTVHVLDGASGFQGFLAHDVVVGAVDLSAAAGARVAAGDADGDGRADLHVLTRDGAGRTVVTVLGAASGFHEVLATHTTPLAGLDDPRWVTALGDHDGDGVADLHVVDLAGPSGQVEVHVLGGATGFATYLTQTATVLPAVDPATWTATLADHDGDGRVDLQLVDRDDQGRTAVHVLGAASGFQQLLTQQLSALEATPEGDWLLF
ncbi:glycoside hydrolase family 16 protein [Nocardioides solisilvae]|uniref:glycoside hydrolase family 16 protein n=1 Tax=Nocardioides solisilvae TaxID=1542435 RepID=UPI000D74A9BD|nr:family 16 glycosylhydrolase [Nocardioides solisilvae]